MQPVYFIVTLTFKVIGMYVTERQRERKREMWGWQIDQASKEARKEARKGGSKAGT